ncbi:MAG: anti-sigma factor [Bacteroidota bacterium]
MNIQEYISSGIVESYVLGLASKEDQLAFEQHCSVYAELRMAKEAFEQGLEKQAFDNAISPPLALKEKILAAAIHPASDTPAPDLKTMPSPHTRLISPVRTINFAKLLAAASIILLAGSTLLNFYFYYQYKSSATRLDELIASNQQLASNNSVMEARLQQDEKDFQMMGNPNMAVVAMKGQPVAPQSLTTVYWDKQSKDVYLLVNSLPRAGAGKQYQLWAIVDGKPVDAGLLGSDVSNGLVKMKNIQKAQAFAITLEVSGGSKTPTVPIYVMGQI